MSCRQISTVLLIVITRCLKIKSTYRKNGEWPNTYTFSKAIAEEIIQTLGGRLPIAIFRPSMGEREKYAFL
jgi:thioester reductase-like protein